ncbi:MAG: hypothetical protein ATN33_08525 [Epulopiscium sp. Nele67-Bin001]|nr:MAG: hypothetical protein BEN18_05540 [Epulopiscium sp. Nuni2H_MBin001]OON91797.1 MAG: hypothetical protein ATN33_08525 [Epulopiscium sp. Nele67-Bin001]
MGGTNFILGEKGMAILRLLIDEAYIVPTKTISANEIFDSLADALNLSKPSIYRIVQQLSANELLKEGLRSGRTKRYYVTMKGVGQFVDYTTMGIEEKERLVLAYMKTRDVGKEVPSWADIYDEVQAHYNGQ